MQFRGSQNEQQVLRRLFNDLQQRIECRNGKHVYLVNDIHPHPHLRWRINSVIPQVPDIIYTVIGGRVNFQNIHTGAGIDSQTSLTAITGVSVMRIQTVYRLCQNFCAAGFTCAARTGKQIGMAHFSADKLRLQCLRHCQLAGYVIKCLRTVLPV